MRPTFSIIFFTVVSGCGFGLLFLVGAISCVAPPVLSRNATLAALMLGVVFAGAGLSSSMLHLGQPQRAWRALSQWRSSWLSREGVASLATFVPVAILFVLVWNGNGESRFVAALVAVLSAITVVCTSGIYTSLKTIRAWSNAWVLPSYLSLAAASAACWLWLVTIVTDRTSFAAWFVVVLCLLGAAIKVGHWRFVDTYVGESTPESATGLGRFGKVRTFEAPHTEENYLTREMGFVLARKHAAKLRMIAIALFAALPTLCAVLSLIFSASIMLAAIASISVVAGLFVERWLFFAQARHKVMLFYARYERA
ncbi:MAG TPA: DmsC/YnfH family molybdoenzyme membrane anchor subunit [Rudaea sp.]|jgi:DMSO reductase anchor subunit|nr:DmsC/YnfH family molybdoenzyme membrane anchor subunit [Rudaea sp.]